MNGRPDPVEGDTGVHSEHEYCVWPTEYTHVVVVSDGGIDCSVWLKK